MNDEQGRRATAYRLPSPPLRRRGERIRLPSPLRGRGVGGEGEEHDTFRTPHPRPLSPEYRGEGSSLADHRLAVTRLTLSRCIPLLFLAVFYGAFPWIAQGGDAEANAIPIVGRPTDLPFSEASGTFAVSATADRTSVHVEE